MKLEDLLAQARDIWGSDVMTADEIAVAMGVVYGDICRVIRDESEKRQVDEQELKKELGNMIFSSIRWADDLGFDAVECVSLATDSQKAYVYRRSSNSDDQICKK